MKKVLCIFLVLMLCFSMAACKQSEEVATVEEQGTNTETTAGAEAAGAEVVAAKTVKDTMTVVVATEPTTLDPAKANSEAIGIVNRFITNALWDFTTEGTYECVLAESYEMVDDTTMHIKLNEGVKFSDGTELTSEDVMWHLVRASQDSVSASQFAFLDAANSTCDDAYNLTVKFTKAWAPAVSTLSGTRGQITSKAAYDAMGEEAFSRAPVGTGPYKVVEWVSGSYIKLAANEYYFGGEVPVKNVVIKFVAEPTARLLEVETGAADIAFNIQATDISRVDALDGYHSEIVESYRYYVLTLSMQEEYFQDQKVRYALAYAIDKTALVLTCSDGVGTAISSYGPPLAVEGMTQFEEMGYDPEKAKALLAEAGYPDGFTIDLHYVSGSVFSRLAETIQQMWSQIGVTANLVESALATYDAQNNGKFQASLRDGTAYEVSNIWTIYESSFGSRLNGNDAWLDEKLLELRTYYPGTEEREALLTDVATYLNEIKFTYPIMVTPNIYAISNNLEGFEAHPSPVYLNAQDWIVYE